LKKSYKFLFFFVSVLVLILFLFLYCTNFSEILKSDSFVLSIFPNKEIDLGKFNPQLWKQIKISSIFLFVLSNIVILKSLFLNIFNNHFTQNSHTIKNIFAQNHFINNDSFRIDIGQNLNGEKIIISERGLYQNILITGTIGTRKDQLRNVSDH